MRLHECDLRVLAALMGDVTVDEARYMANRLVELRYFDTDSVPKNIWLNLCRDAAQFARARYGSAR